MILNSDSAQLIKTNAYRLINAIHSKEDLTDLATASSFEQVFSAVETILTNTEMYFDDEFLLLLNEKSWQSFKATLLVYAFNIINRQVAVSRDMTPHGYNMAPREFGALGMHG